MTNTANFSVEKFIQTTQVFSIFALAAFFILTQTFG